MNTKRLDEIEKQIGKLHLEKQKLQEIEEERVQKPSCRAMIGWCLKSEYGDFCYAKILEAVEPKNGFFYFIFEEISISDSGCAKIEISNHHYPYLNKEWWDTEVPVSGWSRVSEEIYYSKKAEVMKEMNSWDKARKYVLKNNQK